MDEKDYAEIYEQEVLKETSALKSDAKKVDNLLTKAAGPRNDSKKYELLIRAFLIAYDYVADDSTNPSMEKIIQNAKSKISWGD